MSTTEDGLQYDVMVEDALRGVVRQALQHVAERGLPGDHHFYITFRSEHPGVQLADHLRERYPREMTIVLQYQFWDLAVGEESFSVTLSFNNRAEKLVIPFEAVVAFADPSVRFGLQFDAGEDDSDDGEERAPQQAHGQQNHSDTSGEPGDNVVTLDKFRKQ